MEGVRQNNEEVENAPWERATSVCGGHTAVVYLLGSSSYDWRQPNGSGSLITGEDAE